MNVERALGTAVLVTGAIMLGLLARTSARGGRTVLGVTREAPATSHPRASISVARSMLELAKAQASYHAAHGRYAENARDLTDFGPDDAAVVSIQAADSTGWTATGLSDAAGVICVWSDGTGPAAELDPDRLAVPAAYAGYPVVDACGLEPDSVITAALNRLPPEPR